MGHLLNRVGAAVCLLLVLSLFLKFPSTVISGSQSVDWSGFHGVAYRTALNSYVCYQMLPSCDAPAVAPADVAFGVYKSAGFNLARVSLDWRYMEQNTSGFQTILAAEASACDANGINCYYQWSASPGNFVFPADVMNAWGCTTGACFKPHFAANDVIPSGTGTPYDGQPIWQAAWNGLIKPAVQLLDAHPSTVGYSVLNEPSGWSNSQLVAYYLYMAQQIRTLSSKAFIFQANGGGSGGGGSASIAQLAPTVYKPYVFEIHNYQGVLNYDPYPSVAQQCSAAGCTGVLLGEWGNKNYPSGYSSQSQFMTLELDAVKQSGLSEEWFDYSGSDPTTGSLPPNLQVLSQIQAQVFGSTGTTTTTTFSSASTSSMTSTSTTSDKLFSTTSTSSARSSQSFGTSSSALSSVTTTSFDIYSTTLYALVVLAVVSVGAFFYFKRASKKR